MASGSRILATFVKLLSMYPSGYLVSSSGLLRHHTRRMNILCRESRCGHLSPALLHPGAVSVAPPFHTSTMRRMDSSSARRTTGPAMASLAMGALNTSPKDWSW